MRRKLYLAAGAVAALAAAFVAGRFAAPTKVVERSVLDERLVAQAVANARAEWQRSVKDRTVARTTYKDGKPVERVVYVDRETTAGGSSSSSTSSQVQATTRAEASKVTTSARPDWSVGAGALWDPRALSSRPDRIAVELDRRILGTVWLGVRASAGADGAEPRVGVGLRIEW